MVFKSSSWEEVGEGGGNCAWPSRRTSHSNIYRHRQVRDISSRTKNRGPDRLIQALPVYQRKKLSDKLFRQRVFCHLKPSLREGPVCDGNLATSAGRKAPNLSHVCGHSWFDATYLCRRLLKIYYFSCTPNWIQLLH